MKESLGAIYQTAAVRHEDLLDSAFMEAYLRFGSRYFYKYFEFGWTAASLGEPDGFPAYLCGLGLGFRIPALFEGFAFQIDGGATYRMQTSRLELPGSDSPDRPETAFRNIVPQFRLLASVKLLGGFGLIGGLEESIYAVGVNDVSGIPVGLTIVTDLGEAVIASRFFVGLQL